ncbi:iron ABC transporter permease [Jeotgalicoccus huakuii]|nr:iron ABC transporter permease [Jeotgalicoccus huakuii]
MNKTNVVLSIILMLCLVVSVFVGSVSFSDVSTMQSYTIMLDVRLPRVLMAIFLGASLSMSGAVFQIILKNPMADSFTLGMANGAVLGSALTVITVIPVIFAPIMSIICGLLTMVLVLIIARRLDLSYRPETLIITGVLLGSLLSGILYLIILVNPEDTQNISRYMFGSLSGINYYQVAVVMVLSFIAFILLIRHGRQLDLLKLGDIRAHALGVNVSKIRPLLLMIAAVPPLVALGYTGIIALVGIIVPQVIMYLKPMAFIPLLKRSILVGAIYVLNVDTLGRTLFAPVSIPTGVMVMLSAVPIFIYLLYQRSLSTKK